MSVPPPDPSAPTLSPLNHATLTAHEVADLLGVNPKTVYEAASRGEIPSRRLGRRVLFPRVAIEAWLSAPAGDCGTMTRQPRVATKQVTQ